VSKYSLSEQGLKVICAVAPDTKSHTKKQIAPPFAKGNIYGSGMSYNA
jgi:hypothetical protein